MLHQNIQSLKSKIDVLHLIMQGVDLLTLSETWTSKDIACKFDIPGYRLFRKNRESKGGGVAVFVNNDVLATRIDDLEDPTVEGLWLEISLPKS